MSGVISNMNTYVIDTWVPNRLDIFLAACIKEGLFTVAGPTFKINDLDQHGGQISASDTLTITSPGRFNTLYYTLDGSDPRFQGLPQQNTNTTILVYENDDKRVFVSSRSSSDIWKNPGIFDDSRWLDSVRGPGIPEFLTTPDGWTLLEARAVSATTEIQLTRTLSHLTSKNRCTTKMPPVTSASHLPSLPVRMVMTP
jgi:hypothetical protein